MITHKNKNELHLQTQKYHLKSDILIKMEVSHGQLRHQIPIFGSRLTWQTDYRYGRYVTNHEKWKGPSHAVLITGCKSKDISSAKMIPISTATKGTWTITDPKDLRPAELQCETADDNNGEDLSDIDDIKEDKG